MQVSVETLNNIERRITVGVPAERIESEVETRLKKAAQNARIDGFRPGKVPFKVIKQRYGAGVRQEVLGEVMQKTFYDAVVQEKLNPAGMPQIEPKVMEEGKDLEYVATFEVYPEVIIGDLSAVTIEKQTATIEENDIDTMVEQLRKQQTKMQLVDRVAQDGDQVMIDFNGTLDGESFAGGSAENTSLVLGSGRMIPGFEDGIVGMKAGEEKVLQLTFPEDYHAKDLAGKAVEFKVKVNAVNEPVLPELNEELFVQFGVTEGGEPKFREEIKKNMERELSSAIRNKVKSQVIVGLVDLHKIDLPKALLDQEVNRLRQEMMQQYGGGQGFDASMLPAELFADQATQRVSIGLIMSKFVEDEKIELDDARVEKMIEEMAQSYESPEEVVEYIKTNEQQLKQLQSVALEEQVIDRMLERMQVAEVSCSYEEAVKPPEPTRPAKASTENEDSASADEIEEK
ncbi:MAG: trigger factor [Pseudomonadales bacterium]|nr:trigger factor [Pseudomonadales bacterium]